MAAYDQASRELERDQEKLLDDIERRLTADIRRDPFSRYVGGSCDTFQHMSIKSQISTCCANISMLSTWRPEPGFGRNARFHLNGLSWASGSESNGEMAEWLKAHAWKLLWRSATACCRFRLLLRSQRLNGEPVTSIDRRKHR